MRYVTHLNDAYHTYELGTSYIRVGVGEWRHRFTHIHIHTHTHAHTHAHSLSRTVYAIDDPCMCVWVSVSL